MRKMKTLISTFVQSLKDDFIIMIIKEMRKNMQCCFFYETRNIEDIRFYFDYLRGFYSIELAP